MAIRSAVVAGWRARQPEQTHSSEGHEMRPSGCTQRAQCGRPDAAPTTSFSSSAAVSTGNQRCPLRSRRLSNLRAGPAAGGGAAGAAAARR